MFFLQMNLKIFVYSAALSWSKQMKLSKYFSMSDYNMCALTELILKPCVLLSKKNIDKNYGSHIKKV